MPTPNSIFQVARLLRDQEASQRALLLRRQDNAGSKWLTENAPHLMAQLEELSLQWLVIPKIAVVNMDGLKETVRMCREFDQLHFPIQLIGLPPEVSDEEFYDRLDKCRAFLEDEVVPVLQKMPKQEEESTEDSEDAVDVILDEDIEDEEVEVDAIAKETDKQNISRAVSADRRQSNAQKGASGQAKN